MLIVRKINGPVYELEQQQQRRTNVDLVFFSITFPLHIHFF